MKDAFGVDRGEVAKAFEPLSEKEKKAGKMTGGEKAAYGASIVGSAAGGGALGFYGLRRTRGKIGAGLAATGIGASAAIGQRRIKRVNEMRAAEGKKPRSRMMGGWVKD